MPSPSSTFLRGRKRHHRGQTLVEYGIIIAMVSIVVIVVLQALGSSTRNVYQTVDDQIEQANTFDPGGGSGGGGGESNGGSGGPTGAP